MPTPSPSGIPISPSSTKFTGYPSGTPHAARPVRGYSRSKPARACVQQYWIRPAVSCLAGFRLRSRADGFSPGCSQHWPSACAAARQIVEASLFLGALELVCPVPVDARAAERRLQCTDAARHRALIFRLRGRSLSSLHAGYGGSEGPFTACWESTIRRWPGRSDCRLLRRAVQRTHGDVVLLQSRSSFPMAKYGTS